MKGLNLTNKDNCRS